MLILVFGALFAYAGYLYAKPEKFAELKAKIMGVRRARTMATTSSSVSRAGLAANDGCSNYVAPTSPPLAAMPPVISADATQSHQSHA